MRDMRGWWLRGILVHLLVMVVGEQGREEISYP